MDCSKVIAAASRVDDDPWQYPWGHRKEFKESLDTVMIPTLAATGTDINPYAVIMDEGAVSKTFCVAECLYPTMTMADPEIHASVPLHLTIWGAMDILSHTFEFYFNGYFRSIFQNRFSEAIVHSVMECVNILVEDPKDLRARGELWWSSIMAWGGLTKIGRGDPDMACHTIAEGFVPFYDTHHGATLGVITPRWMKYVVEDASPYFARFAENLFGIANGSELDQAKKGVERYIAWLRDIGAPATLQELTGSNIAKDKLREIARKTFDDAGGQVGLMRPLKEDDVFNILDASCSPL